jgi:coproporphyrinogen III oxidase-like Fe-S oxidoreductase
LKREVSYWQSELDCAETWDTVYFGGGTPSIYKPHELGEVLQMFSPS